VPVTAFFRRFEDVHNAVHTKSGQGVEMERRGTRAGHQYNLLGHLGQNASGVVVEPYLITLDSDSDVFPTFQHEGIETIYMLEGEVDYRHGQEGSTTSNPATRCSSTPMRRMGRKPCASCRSATCRSSPTSRCPGTARLSPLM
jgi:hypothetical protein